MENENKYFRAPKSQQVAGGCDMLQHHRAELAIDRPGLGVDPAGMPALEDHGDVAEPNLTFVALTKRNSTTHVPVKTSCAHRGGTRE